MTSTTTNAISKVAALAAGFALVAMSFASIVPAAHAQTTTTTTMTSSQVAALEAQIASLQAQLSAASGTTSMAASTTFTMDLTIGSTGSQVTALQTWLIAKGYSIPAGATGYFGTQTQTALAAYQAASGITPAAGYFGPITRAKVNASATTTTTTTTTTTGTGTTTTTGSTTLSGGEGTVNNFQTVGATSVTLGTGASQKIFGFQFQAGGSDLQVSRIYYDMYNTNGVISGGSYGTTRPWNIFNTATLTDASGNTVATLDASNQNNYSEDGTASNGNQIYRLDFENVNEIVKMNATQQYYLTLTTDSAFSSGNAPAQFNIGLAAQGLRATDAMGIQEYSSANATYSTVNINTNSTGSLTLSAGSDNPQTTTIMANQNTATQNVVLNTFTLQNTGQSSVELYTLPVIASTTNPGGSNVVGNVVQDLKLYQGSTLLDTESPQSSSSGSANYISGAGGTLSFKNINLTIPAGTTESFSVQGDIQPVNGINVNTNPAYSGASVTVTVPGTGTDIETSGGSLVSPSGASTGYPISFAVNGLSVASAPTSATATAVLANGTGSQQTGTFSFVFNVTAFGQTIYVPSGPSAFGLTIYDQSTSPATATSSPTVTNPNVTAGITSTANRSPLGNFQVNSGQTAAFTVTATVSRGGNSHYFYAVLNWLNYGVTDAAPATASSTLPSNYTTNSVSLSS